MREDVEVPNLLEEEAAVALKEYVDEHTITTTDFCAEAEIKNEATFIFLEDLKLPSLISMYCSPGAKFNAELFKASVWEILKDYADNNIRVKMDVHKMFNKLEDWRVKQNSRKKARVSEYSSCSSSLSSENSRPIYVAETTGNGASPGGIAASPGGIAASPGGIAASTDGIAISTGGNNEEKDSDEENEL